MPFWKNSLMTTVDLIEKEIYPEEPCQVIIDENRIVVDYIDENHHVIYEGKNYGTGHFNLKCDEKSGSATLHMIPGENILEGYWIESGYEGFWRIYLKE